MISINNNNEIILSAQDKVFVDNINDIITMYGQIPYTVPPKLIVNNIKDSAKLFYDQYYKATSRRFYRVEYQDFVIHTGHEKTESVLTSTGAILKLPTFVKVVRGIHKTNKKTFNQTMEATYIDRRISPYGSSIRGINDSMYALEMAVMMIAENANNSIFGREVPFRYNNLSGILDIHDKIDCNIVLETDSAVDIQDLYADAYFKRHVLGTVKRELKRVLGGHTFQLPGGGTMNADEICNNLEDVEKVEDILKAGGGIGDIILMRD